MPEQLTLSVVMPNFNHSRFLPKSLGGIFGQSYRPSEFIIIDDGSTDNSVEIINTFAQKDPLIRLIRNETNMGVVYNINRLLELASGDYICFASADDLVLPGFFEESMGLLRQHPQAGLCSGLALKIDEDGNNQGAIRNPVPTCKSGYLSPTQCAAILIKHGPWMPGNATVFRRQALLETGGFRSQLGAYCDSFIMGAIVLRYGACFIPKPLAAFRVVEGSYSVSMRNNLSEVLKIRENARQLIRSTFSDLFPPEYVEQWERELLYMLGKAAWAPVHQAQEKFLGDVDTYLFSSRSWSDRWFVKLLRFMNRMQTLFAAVYLFARFGSPRLYLLQKLRTRKVEKTNKGSLIKF